MSILDLFRFVFLTHKDVAVHETLLRNAGVGRRRLSESKPPSPTQIILLTLPRGSMEAAVKARSFGSNVTP